MKDAEDVEVEYNTAKQNVNGLKKFQKKFKGTSINDMKLLQGFGISYDTSTKLN